MPSAVLDGIDTRYEVLGDGPPILMYAPGGFDATIEKWRTLGIYARIKLLEHLPKKYKCIVFDRRAEASNWREFALQGKLLLESLGIERAHLMGGCMGCSCVLAFAVAYPQATRSMLLWWPVGGAKYRIRAQERFAQQPARRNLIDRDTSPGAEPEELMKLDIPAIIIPGRDESHATSAARYLEECLPKSQYWDVLPEAQTEGAASTRLTAFLDGIPS